VRENQEAGKIGGFIEAKRVVHIFVALLSSLSSAGENNQM
jgi:hypothetical protein